MVVVGGWGGGAGGVFSWGGRMEGVGVKGPHAVSARVSLRAVKAST